LAGRCPIIYGSYVEMELAAAVCKHKVTTGIANRRIFSLGAHSCEAIRSLRVSRPSFAGPSIPPEGLASRTHVTSAARPILTDPTCPHSNPAWSRAHNGNRENKLEGNHLRQSVPRYGLQMPGLIGPWVFLSHWPWFRIVCGEGGKEESEDCDSLAASS